MTERDPRSHYAARRAPIRRRRQRGFIINPFAFGAAATDPLFANVKYGSNFTGPNGSTSAADFSASARAITFTGGSIITTAESTFGAGSSLAIDGAADHLSMPDSADWAVGANVDFCWEFVCKPNGNFGFNSDIVSQAAGAGTYPYRFYRGNGSNVGWGLLTFDSAGTLRANIAASGTHTASTWAHVCFVRESTTFRIYIGGVQVASSANAAFSNALFDAGATLKIGEYNGSGFAGWIQSARFTVGNARYPGGTTFTPPSALFPTS